MPDAPDFLDVITKDFERLQKQKSRTVGGVEGRVLQNMAFDAGEQYTYLSGRTLTATNVSQGAEKNKLHLVFNLIAQRGRKLIGRLASMAPVFKARPDKRDKKAFEHAEIVDRLLVALDQKVDQPSKTWELLDWMRKGGVAFEYVPWLKRASLEVTPQFSDGTPENPDGELLYRDLKRTQLLQEEVIVPKSERDALVNAGQAPESFEVFELVSEVGDVGSRVFGPLQVFVDQSVHSIAELAPDQAVYIAEARTHGWIAEEYGDEAIVGLDADKELAIVTTSFVQTGDASVASTQLSDLIPTLAGKCDPDDPPMNVVVERYQPTSKKFPHGRFTCFIPGKKVLYDGDNPYEEIPVVDFHWSPVTTTMWTKDYCTDLIAPQRFLNKRMSQLGEFANSAAYTPTLLGPGLKATDLPTDYPGVVKDGLADNGTPKVGHPPPKQMPAMFPNSIELVIKLLNDLSGGSDLFEENKFFGQMRGPQAIPLMQELLDTEWGPLYLHLGERLARVKQMRLNRVKQYYPAMRTLHYTGRDQRDEVLEFHTEDILRSGTTYNITVDRGSVMPEFRALKEARLAERLNSNLAILYTNERTGRLDKGLIAKELQFGDAAPEARETQDRKLAIEFIDRMWKDQDIPPVLPFYDHGAMLDELEAAMKTTEFHEASQPVQERFLNRWQEHQKFLQEQAAREAQAQQSMMVQNAVAQATQQAAAQAASETVKSVFAQIQAQAMQAPTTEQLLMTQAQANGVQ